MVLPALNEEETVADVIATIMPLYGTLVDEIIVLDSGSTDATAERALAAGATALGEPAGFMRVVTHEAAGRR